MAAVRRGGPTTLPQRSPPAVAAAAGEWQFFVRGAQHLAERGPSIGRLSVPCLFLQTTTAWFCLSREFEDLQ